VAEVKNVIGDVEGKTAVLVTMIDTGAPYQKELRLLRQQERVRCMPAHHPVFSPPRVSGCQAACLRGNRHEWPIPVPGSQSL